ncbi:hypothetical protein MGSAQ_001471 [marine sediment metagenome]|uniref:Uncharacterized protein n=1 Tax=marine sediment metagenome TaxID=412755 RepID=A0A1B6NVP0_9ZZZZ
MASLIFLVTTIKDTAITTKNKVISAVIKSANDIQKGFSPSSFERCFLAYLLPIISDTLPN